MRCRKPLGIMLIILIIVGVAACGETGGETTVLLGMPQLGLSIV